MLGKILMHMRSEYPGYKVKKGVLCSGTEITSAMLKGAIPLVVDVSYLQGGGGGGLCYVYLTSNINSVQFARYSYNGTIVEVNNCKMDLETMFGDGIYDITNLSITTSYNTKANRSISVVKWLEKSGGGRY